MGEAVRIQWSYLYQTLQKLLKCVLIRGYWTLKIPLTEGKIIFLAKAFYLNRDKNDYFYFLQT
jgi:hypothetical protein